MWLKIKILSWKSLQYRKKFWLGTIIEIIFPCLLFIFLNYSVSIIMNQSMQYQLYERDLPLALSSITALSFLLMGTLTIKRIVNEKNSGMKELMKMMGLESWMIWTGWILHNLFINIISITIILCTLNYGKGRILKHSNMFLIWNFFIMYTIASTFFCFAISSFFNQPLLAIISYVIIWVISYSLPLFKFLSHIIYNLSMLFPNSAMKIAVTTILHLEYVENGLQLSSLFSPIIYYTMNVNSSVGSVLISFVFQCFLYGLIAWYLDLVMPGKYGSAKPLNFLFKRSKIKVETYKMTNWNESNSLLFEDPPNEHEVGISVQYLHKYFGNFHAVNGVNLDFYKGQITAVLGHNGAGKTTTMSIITGLFSPSYGSVKFNGSDIFSNIDQYRKCLGLCPQHNLHFSYLTTLNHLIFFGMLKGMTLKNAKSEGLHLLTLLNLLHKKDNLVNELSGGMKRKVSLAIALVGSPDILILDEPTSGMDTESRREMWDLILSLRESKTILITTHFMEEADVLGDRIAIMDHGKVKCYGTSIFLKRAYGTGHNLTIVKEQPCDEFKIMAEIKKIIPEVKIQSSITSHVIINIVDEYTDQLPDLLRMLEKKKQEFCIKGVGIANTTMEDVFLRAEKNIQFEIDVLSSAHTSRDVDSYQLIIKKEIDCSVDQVTKLLQQHMPECSLKSNTETQTIYNLPAAKKNEYASLINVLKIEERNLKLKSCKITSPTLSDLYPELHRNLDDKDEPKDSTIGVPTFLENNSSGIHLLKNQFKILIEKKFKYAYRQWPMTLIIGIIPVLFGILTAGSYDELTKFISFIFLNFSLLYFHGYSMALPFNERLSGIKHLQLMTKLSPIMYWTTCFLWDYFFYTIVIIVTLIFIYFFDNLEWFTDSTAIYVLLTLLLIFGWCGIIYAYVYSFFMKTFVGSMILFIIVNWVILLGSVIYEYFKEKYNSRNVISIGPFLIFPYNSYTYAMYRFLRITDANIHKLPGEKLSYFVFKSNENEYGILEETLYLLFSSMVYIVLILFFEYKIFERVYRFGLNTFVGINNIDIDKSEDPDINNERQKVDVAINDVINNKRQNVDVTQNYLCDTQTPIFVIDNLVKMFDSKFIGVRGISFTVSSGECFGLLGVNGAGKTTTFRMLTGDIFPSKGNAFIQTDKLYKLNSDTSQFVSMIGYCPQFDALNDHLTGKETLKLMAILRGISPKDTKRHVNKWIILMGLEECKDRLSGTYSGGNKRKLSTAMALIGNPPVVFLDEPTCGVDPVSRRNLWKLLTSNRKNGQAIILTSHSMDECEALCNRLTIMVDGAMKCIGDIQYLKNRYGQGYTVMVKLGNYCTINAADLKTDIERRFYPGIYLKDEHRSLLHYHITNPQTSLSKIFDHMRLIKENYSSVEDYTVCDTTLEQVFIAFAKRQAVLNTNV